MKFPILTLAISAALTAVFCFFGSVPENLIWEQENAISLQLISSHFVHISGTHATWNIVAFAILGSMLEQHSKQRLLLTLITGSVCVSVYLLFFFTLPAYAGLSGVLNTLWVVALYQIAQKPEYRIAASLSLFASCAKIMFEWISESAMFSSLIWPPDPAAHLAGMLGGLLFCIACQTFTPKQIPADTSTT